MKNDNLTMKNGAAYIRVSTDKQEELSPDAQKRLIIDYCKKNNIILTEDLIFQDLGISGKRADKREEFRRMLSLAKSDEHPIDIILVWKFSRFARNQEESIVYKNLLRKNKVEVVSISEPIIDGAFGSLIERIIEWMDEYYSINLSTEVIGGMTEKAMRGGYQAAPPLGYKMNSEHIPEICESEAHIVRKIFSQFISGTDISVIARNMNGYGFKTRRNNPFEYRAIRYILENPFYVGKVRWNRAKHSAYQENDPEDIIIEDGVHEHLISDADWESACQRMKQYSRPATKKRALTGCKHWLSGMIQCPVCGSNLCYNNPASLDKRAYPYFQCYKYAKGAHQGSQAVSESVIVESVLSSIKSVVDSGEFTFSYDMSVNDDDSQIYRSLLDKLPDKEKRIKTAYMDGIDSLEEYKANKLLIQREREELEKKINETKKPQTISSDDMLERLKNVYSILINVNISYDKKAVAIRSIITKIGYNRETKECSIFYYYS